METYDVENLTDEELAKLLRGSAPNKWHNRKVEADGEVFDSALEARYWQVLKWRQQAGEVRRLKRQQWVTVQGAFYYQGKLIRAVRLRIDFWYEEWQSDGRWAWVFDDTKGPITPAWAIKWKMLQRKYRDRKDTLLRLTYEV